MTYSRRQFGKLALSSLPVAAAALTDPLRLIAQSKPDSKINGVQIGVITPYSYHNMPNDAESLLRLIVKNGINATEIQCPPVEEWAGAPAEPPAPPRPPAGQPRPKLTMAEIAARKAYAASLTQWRLAAPMEKFAALRKMYNDAGVSIYGFKLELRTEMQDAEFDYAFRTAKTLGANQLTMEMPDDGKLTARIGEFASKHKLMVGFHAHTQARPTTWDEAMAQSPYNGINLDIGHYVAAGNHDALEFIRKHHERITSMHLKDRKFPENGGANMPWGQGDTPIKEALQLMKREGYKFPATIELEYAPPAGSDSEKEVARCLAYARAALA
jgi:sugar phosphate isomerase/epimerase